MGDLDKSPVQCVGLYVSLEPISLSPRELAREKSMKLASEPKSINTGDITVCEGEVRVTETCSLS